MQRRRTCGVGQQQDKRENQELLKGEQHEIVVLLEPTAVMPSSEDGQEDGQFTSSLSYILSARICSKTCRVTS
jgi:hypothetical protein